MPTIVLDLLKYVFLAVLYIFMARAVKAIYVEIRPPQTARVQQAAKRQGAASARRSKKAPRKVTVVEGQGLKGRSFDLDSEMLIGRADKCHIVLEDTYASQVHARIFSKGEGYMVEDMGSTNGTYLNRQKITSPTELQRGDHVKIGKTVLEMRK
ncbi:MAG: FHA domain-containing protein FhaB/FipA [Actinomycetota bacterium]